jgi:hypothetical protein
VAAVAVKLAEVAPAGTVTEAGTGSAVLLEDSAMTLPPAGAAAVSVTVHVVDAPDIRLAGAQTSEEAAGPPPPPAGAALNAAIWAR